MLLRGLDLHTEAVGHLHEEAVSLGRELPEAESPRVPHGPGIPEIDDCSRRRFIPEETLQAKIVGLGPGPRVTAIRTTEDRPTRLRIEDVSPCLAGVLADAPDVKGATELETGLGPGT
jgi:hypothetical protein